MSTVVKLRDGTEAIIRPMNKDDVDRSFAFFQTLPEEDRIFLRVDVTRRDVVEERIKQIDAGGVRRLVAVIGDEIVADGALELEAHEWKRKELVGEIRLIVGPSCRRNGLGMLMARELYALAANARVDEIVVRMMRPQYAAHSIFRKLGFEEAGLLRDYVKDLTGRQRDLIVMRCDLAALWRELERYLSHSDWQRTR